MEGRKNRRKEESETGRYVPAPPFGRRAQAGEAAIRNRRVAHGGAVCFALPVPRTGVPPCQTSWLAKSKGCLRLADSRKSANALQKGRRGGAGGPHFRSDAHQPYGECDGRQGRRPAYGCCGALQGRCQETARRSPSGHAERDHKKRTQGKNQRITAPKTSNSEGHSSPDGLSHFYRPSNSPLTWSPF